MDTLTCAFMHIRSDICISQNHKLRDGEREVGQRLPYEEFMLIRTPSAIEN